MFDNDYTIECYKTNNLVLLVDMDLSSTTSSLNTVIGNTSGEDGDSIGNASLYLLEAHEVHEDLQFTYLGPKVIVCNERPATMCKVSTIGVLYS